MRRDRLNIDIREESPNADFERLVDFAQALVAQHPLMTLTKCVSLLNRYIQFMRLNKWDYRIRLEEDTISLSLGRGGSVRAMIHTGSKEQQEII